MFLLYDSTFTLPLADDTACEDAFEPKDSFSLEKEKDTVMQFLTHIQYAQRPFIRYQHYALSLTFSPARRASYTTSMLSS